MSKYTDAIRRAAIIKVLQNVTNDYRTELEEGMEAGDRKTVWQDGVKLGTVLMTEPEPSFVVDNPTEFTAWVVENFPDAIVTTQSVVPGWKESVLSAGKVVVTDKKTGEITEHVPPGIKLVQGRPSLRVTPNEIAYTAARALLPEINELTADADE